MLPFKKILCPTDFTEPSYEALRVANELALHFSAELLLIHVVNPIDSIPIGSPSGASYVSYIEDVGALAGKKLDEVARSFEERLNRLKQDLLEQKVSYS